MTRQKKPPAWAMWENYRSPPIGSISGDGESQSPGYPHLDGGGTGTNIIRWDPFDVSGLVSGEGNGVRDAPYGDSRTDGRGHGTNFLSGVDGEDD